MTPKSLLRRAGGDAHAGRAAPRAASSGSSRDQPAVDPAKVTRLLLCSGKVYYDLVEGRGTSARTTPSPSSALEQLYPFPDDAAARSCSRRCPKLEELVWVQEEPRNMGAWRFMLPRLHELACRRRASSR